MTHNLEADDHMNLESPCVWVRPSSGRREHARRSALRFTQRQPTLDRGRRSKASGTTATARGTSVAVRSLVEIHLSRQTRSRL